MATDLRKLELEKLRLLEQQKVMEEGLPHLHSFKFYKWARKFFESKNQTTLLCAANQISKSSIQIRKTIHWATEPKLWPELWPANSKNPFFIPDFWYLYPTLGVATSEFEKKWTREFLPRGEYKFDKQYGWTEKYTNKLIDEIRFNSGATIKFMSYSQDTQNIQTATLAAVFTDEEMPEENYHEISARLFGTDGYFHMVFTATLGQEFWRRAIEEDGRHRLFPTSFRQQVSAYDCLEYEDGSPTPWTVERIERNKARCRSQAEIDKRIHGKFVLDEGLVYPSFERNRNMCRPFPIPNEYWIYAGIDIGSGGDHGHPAAIIFVALQPDLKKGYIFKGWRGDDVSTTASDILDQYLIMKGSMPVMAAHYDFASKEFQQIATRRSVPVLPANKSHSTGESILNVLYKNKMLMIFEDDPELEKLVSEIMTLRVDTPRLKAKNDFIDAERYAVSSIPWDWSALNQTVAEQRKGAPNPDRLREIDQEGYEEYLRADEINNAFIEANSLMEEF